MQSENAHISCPMSDQPPSPYAARQESSDLQPTSVSPTLIQPPAPAPQLEEDSMSDHSSDSDSNHLTSDTQSEPPNETMSPNASQSEQVEDSGIPEGAHTSPLFQSPVNPLTPIASSSEDGSQETGSNLEYKDPPLSSSPCGGALGHTLVTCPLLIPIPESDVEEEEPSEIEITEGARSSVNGSSDIGGRATTTNTASRSVRPNGPFPSESDDYQPIWILGDTVLEKRDRQVHERWRAGLGVTFVVANVLSVLILCTAIELYRRTKAAHPGLIAKIRARHIARKGRNSPFSPIVSLFFEAEAPFIHSNTAFLAGLCTTLICTLLSDLALRWVGRFESRSPPEDASPRDRMIARMEWNERMERRGVPWLLEIGIPGLLYIALCLFFTGAIMRSFPYLNKAICGVFGILFMVASIRGLWSYEPALDVRSRPKPISSQGR